MSFLQVNPSRRYLLISPCRDEAQYLRRTLDCVAAQSVRPALWVIVDDGSTDETPAILEEYADVLGDHPEFVAEIVESFSVCYPLTELSVIRHEPDNRFLECALAANAEFIVTVNTAPGHFDRKQYQAVNVARPGEFLNVPDVGRLLKKLNRG